MFKAVAHLPYFRKQVQNNASILENSTHGIDQILNYVILKIMPLAALVVALLLFSLYLNHFSDSVSWIFILSSAILLFILPQVFSHKKRPIFQKNKQLKEELRKELLDTFNGRIEIEKYNLAPRAVNQFNNWLTELDKTEKSLFNHSLMLQLIGGFGFSLLSITVIGLFSTTGLNPAMTIGIFFGVLAQAELAEMLFNPKIEKNAVKQHTTDIQRLLVHICPPAKTSAPEEALTSITFDQISAKIPETAFVTPQITVTLNQGSWVAIYGATGSGKTTLLNSFFFPEYRNSGQILWNNKQTDTLKAPQCIYVTQNAFLLTGTVRENFLGYSEQKILEVIHIVDLQHWYGNLPHGLDSWIGENGKTLSGGERKKMLLAQALLKNPQLLVVDEVTAGIGFSSARSIFHKIRQNYPGITILMTTHNDLFQSEVDHFIQLTR